MKLEKRVFLALLCAAAVPWQDYVIYYYYDYYDHFYFWPLAVLFVYIPVIAYSRPSRGINDRNVG